MSNKKLNENEKKTFQFIKNRINETSKSPSIRDIMNHLNFSSPSSAVYIIDKLVEKKYIYKQKGKIKMISSEIENDNQTTVDVPLIGSTSCGIPLFAKENFEKIIKISTNIAKPPFKYFLLRVKGDSMDEEGINDNDLVLVKSQHTAKNKEIVLALIDDEATIKEINYTDNAVILKPKSTNPMNKPIILTNDFNIQGVVVTSFSGL